ncbi:MAG: DUF4136 domain-containing protein [Rhodospirillales bacterium]|nr:DUF4136 domain-containing protein [Acetobacter sp.]
MPFGSFLKQTLLTVVCCSALAAASLQAQQVQTDYDHNANFESYHTFSFARVQTSDPLYEQRVRDNITTELQQHGLQLVPSGGDLAVTAIGGVHEAREYNTFYNNLGPGFGWRGWGWWGGGWGGTGLSNTRVQQIPVGTLLVDLYDTHTQNLVFRGRAQADLHQHAEKNIRLVEKAVDKMFDHFPPKHSS